MRGVLVPTSLIGLAVVTGAWLVGSGFARNPEPEWQPAGLGRPESDSPYWSWTGFTQSVVGSGRAQAQGIEESRDDDGVRAAPRFLRIVIAADVLKFEGSGPAGGRVRLQLDGETIGPVLVDADGRWRVTAGALKPGDHAVSVSALMEPAGVSVAGQEIRIAIPDEMPSAEIVAFEDMDDVDQDRLRAQAERLAEAANKEFDDFTRRQEARRSAVDEPHKSPKPEDANGQETTDGTKSAPSSDGTVADWFSKSMRDYHEAVVSELARKGGSRDTMSLESVPPPARPVDVPPARAYPDVNSITRHAHDWLRDANRTYQDVVVKDLSGGERRVADGEMREGPVSGIDLARRAVESVGEEARRDRQRGQDEARHAEAAEVKDDRPRRAAQQDTAEVEAPVEARRRAEEETAKRLAEHLARREEERRQAGAEEERRRAEAETAKRLADQLARRAEEQRQAEAEEGRRLAEAESAKRLADQLARREEERRQAEAEEERRRTEAETAKRLADQLARREEERRQAEEERRKSEQQQAEAERREREAVEQRQRELDARRLKELLARREAERREAEAARRAAEEERLARLEGEREERERLEAERRERERADEERAAADKRRAAAEERARIAREEDSARRRQERVQSLKERGERIAELSDEAGLGKKEAGEATKANKPASALVPEPQLPERPGAIIPRGGLDGGGSAGSRLREEKSKRAETLTRLALEAGFGRGSEDETPPPRDAPLPADPEVRREALRLSSPLGGQQRRPSLKDDVADGSAGIPQNGPRLAGWRGNGISNVGTGCPDPRAGQTIQLPGTYVVARGDTLWHISRRHYYRGILYRRIYRANRRKIRNPHWIYPCQKFWLPRR